MLCSRGISPRVVSRTPHRNISTAEKSYRYTPLRYEDLRIGHVLSLAPDFELYRVFSKSIREHLYNGARNEAGSKAIRTMTIEEIQVERYSLYQTRDLQRVKGELTSLERSKESIRHLYSNVITFSPGFLIVNPQDGTRCYHRSKFELGDVLWDPIETGQAILSPYQIQQTSISRLWRDLL